MTKHYVTVGEIQEKLARDPKSMTMDDMRALEQIEKFKKSKQPAAADDARFCFSKHEVAGFLGCTVRNVEKLQGEGHLNKSAEGRIDVRGVFAYVTNIRDRDRTSESVSKQLKREQARFRKLKADMAEIDLKMQNGEAIDTEKVVIEINRAFMSLRDNMLDAGRRIPEQCCGQDVRTMSDTIEKEFRRILDDFARLIKTPIPEQYQLKMVGNIDSTSNDTK